MSYRIKHEAKTIHADEAHLLSGMEHLLIWLEQNRRSVLIGVLVAALAIAAVVGALWYDARQDEAAADLYQQAAQLSLDRPADNAAKAEDNLKQAIALYRRVVEEHPRSRSAQLALFQLGNALVQINDVKGGIEAYSKYVATYGTNAMMLGLVHQRLAYAHLLNGDREAAVKAFLNVVALPGTLNKDHVLFELGKLEESLARPEGALAHYQDLVKVFPNSPLAGEAAVRMKALEAKKTPASGASVTTPAAEAPIKR
ncbi:MAG: tetratricopeptide repeat protein [Nitrospirae bacterium]|nr:tetratricopeptide repeat protein [Nitrospirota bacterium]